MLENRFFLIVEQGEPHDKGTEIALAPGETLLGRPFKSHQPDIPFTSLYISKKHLSFSFQNNQCVVNDLSSKHGTQINGKEINPFQPYIVNHDDIINLAQGTVVLRVSAAYDSESEYTIDLVHMNTLPKIPNNNAFFIDSERREVFIDNQKLNIFGKDIELLLLLFENRNRPVTYNEIRIRVWSERPLSPENNVPDVGNDEITALVYRLRKKLDIYGNQIITVPRYGYRLDF
ncbi:MAG: FHA domain-containing protein [Methanobacterium sp.]